MNKGEELGKLIDAGNEIGGKMDDIFKEYNVPMLDLKSLPQEGMDEWTRLFKEKDEITKKIGELFKH